MSAVLQPAAPPPPSAQDADMRAALAWETQARQADDKNTWQWLWESIQGDFNEDRSTGQIAFDAAVSMVPLVDQICDLRDLIANCRSISSSKESDDNTWKYVALGLTLIGLFPTLGSALKGVLKICFVFVRRHGVNKVDEAVDAAMTWVITHLRHPRMQAYLRERKVDEVFGWLAKAVREHQSKIKTSALLKNFDQAIGTLKGLLGKVTWLPSVGAKAQSTIAMLERVRASASSPLNKVDDLLQQIMASIARRLDMEALVVRHGIMNANNVHFRGVLPETRAVTLMKQTDPAPSWLSKGKKGEWAEQKSPAGLDLVKKMQKKDPLYPGLTDGNIKSFHSMEPFEIKGPAKLYRVVSPTNGAMGDCWIPEEVWNKILSSSDPKAAWRKYLAVWPDWNPNSQFVVMDIPAGKTLKSWRGPASSQIKKEHPDFLAHLEGGWDQVIIKPAGKEFDATTIYKRTGGKGTQLQRTEMSYGDYSQLSPDEKALYAPVRERINHPDIKGPFNTGWGSTDFDAQWTDGRIGLPSLPGQVTN